MKERDCSQVDRSEISLSINNSISIYDSCASISSDPNESSNFKGGSKDNHLYVYYPDKFKTI